MHCLSIVSATFLVLLSGAAAAPALSPNQINKIVGGSLVQSQNDFPYMAAFQLVSNGNIFCGGALIAENLVLTAAHCTTRPLDTVRISARRKYIDISAETEKGVEFKVFKWIVHPEYAPQLNDIAIGVLNVTKNPGNQNITTAKFASSDTSLLASGTETTILGWGRTSETGPASSGLQKAKVPILSTTECRTNYLHSQAALEKITDKVICAGRPEGGVDACSADSGGPMIGPDNLVHGIVAWGEGCARPGRPGVYVKVAAYSQWIKEIVKGCADVADFKAAIKRAFSPYLGSFTAIQLKLFQPDGTTKIDPEERIEKLDEFNVGIWTPLVVTVDELPKPAPSDTFNKRLAYKGMSSEESCLKYLDAVANEIHRSYDFDFTFKKPKMDDLLAAIEGQQGDTWDYRKNRHGQPLTTIPLPSLFSKSQWDFLKSLNTDTNNRIHDARMPCTNSGKPFVILPHSKYEAENVNHLKSIAAKVDIVSDEDYLIVKDEFDSSE